MPPSIPPAESGGQRSHAEGAGGRHGREAAPSPPPFLGEGAGGRGCLRFALFAVALGLWTWKLLEPNPVPEAVSAGLSGLLSGDRKFYLAKSLHAGAYAFLTVLALTLPVPRYWRWYFVGLLALHGAATEVGQTFVPNRTGRVADVVIDWCGIGLGVLTWVAARRALRPPAP